MAEREDPARVGGQDRPSPAVSEDPRVFSLVAGLWEKYKEKILEQAASLERACKTLVEGSLDEEGRRAAIRDAHKLSGTLGSFGFPEGSQAAHEIERLLEAADHSDPARAGRIHALAAVLRQDLEQA